MPSSLEKLFPDKERREIIRKVLKKNVHKSDGNSVAWEILDYNKKSLQSRKGSACFVQLPADLAKHIKANARYVRVIIKSSIKEAVGIAWVKMCIENNAIADTMQSPQEIYHRGLLIDLVAPQWTDDVMYVSMCCLRYLREGITFVQNIVELVDNAKVPFWQAFFFSHGHSIGNVGHSWLGFGNSIYNYNVDSDADKNNILLIKHLKEYFEGKHGRKTTHVFSKLNKGKTPSWRVAQKMTCSEKLCLKDRTEMLTDKATAAIKAKNLNKAKLAMGVKK